MSPRFTTLTAANGVALTLFTDASGAEAVVRVDGFLFACSYVCGPRVRCIHSTSSSSTRREVSAAKRARERFREAVLSSVDAAWTTANLVMYVENGGPPCR